eukprot:CAMPEP_0206376056 /NCGR_PEP_ID=MMETSP0294-20121207/9246_1 /ASSEMBLY_ACC=CAM_ASM_000327 /TAXON_ID=39354 /ORGANISM="Heterosigma akashiwo, Strain CCMP2393" /LENGTH=42 /DNA_ID= /DNA_START= /DNA_END= /DNA_ORIENTATION=
MMLGRLPACLPSSSKSGLNSPLQLGGAAPGGGGGPLMRWPAA